MRNGRRPVGRFFCLVIAAGLLCGLPLPSAGQSGLTKVIDTVYRADGTTASGTVLISWPAFTTADGKAVAAGSLSVQLGNGGSFAANLAANTGAQPSGVYYKVVYQLEGQAPSTEYWVVPATGSIGIGSVRAKLMPPTIAAQVLTRDVADTNYVHVTGDQTMNGVVTFATPPSVPTPQKTGDAANKGYVDAANANLLASPVAIGSTKPNAGTFTVLNNIINPLTYAGSDVGAQINNAISANHCWYGQNTCILQLPNGAYSYSTTITIPFGATLQCGGQTTDFIRGTLNYAGTGTAIALTGSTSQLRNCAISAPNASVVIDNSGQSTTVDSIYFTGGGSFAGTIIRAHGNKQVYNNVQAEGFKGIGFQCDHAIDVFLDTFDFYGVTGNTTGTALLLETGCAGIHVDHFSGGNSGLHGLWVRNTLGGGNNPIQLFFNDFVSDCTYSDGWYFDPDLNNIELDAHFVNSWAAGAGLNCSNGTTVQAHKAGIRISGGSAINISNSKIRANTGSGLAIDNSTGHNSSGIVIGDNQILSNNINNDGTESGIDITQVVAGLSIHDNTITNSLEAGTGHQRYGISIASSSTGVNVYGNDIFGNVTASTNYAAGVVFDPLTTGDVTVQNLTVNGTCTGCGSGGGGGNLSSPGPIGNTAPNSATFTTLSAQVEGKRYKVEGFPSTCTINSVAYTTQFDCAFQTAYYAAQTQSATQTLELGNDVYLTNVGLQQSGVYVVNVIGAAKTDTTEGLNGGSVIRMNATTGNAVVTLSKLAAAPLRSSLVYRDFVIDANHKSPACLDASSMRESLFSHISCENATGSNYWVRFGDSSAGGLGQNHDMQIGPIKIVSPYAYTALANVTANVVGGAISTSGYTVASGGTGYLNGPTVTAYLIGYGAGANPCTVMPTGLHATVAGNVVTSVSSSTVASGCSGNVYVRVPDLPAAAYGFKNEFTTDSTFTDIIVEGVGNVAAIYDAGNAANVWIHAHAWQYQPVGVESHGAGWWWGLQCDAMVHYCVDFEGSNGSPHMLNTLVIDQPAGAGMYFLGAGVLDGTTRDDYAPGNIPADWHRFVSYAVGPVNESVSNFQNYFPPQFQATGFQSYNAPAVDKFDYHGFADKYLFGDVKSQINFKDIITHFATTNIVNGALLQGFSDNAGTRKWLIDSSTGNATFNNLTVNGTCTGCGIGGTAYGYYVSKYASIQAAIDTAYNNGPVQGGGVVIDDRTAPYSGPGFIVRDSVTVKLAPTTYTITGTVTYNNGVSNVTAGIISMPGSHIVGAGTSANHGTNVNAGAGLNADVIATSTVGTGAGANAQWWHWGSIEGFHMNGNKASQTAGTCINVENMGETAVLRELEVGNCYADDIRLEGNFATQSEISNITVNGAGQFGVNLDNFQGVGVLRGLSGDSNATSIIRFNGNQSATLTVLGLKAEEEISGQDPLITIDMPADGSQPSLYIVGGYTYGRPGVQDVIKIINGKSGAGPFVQVNNFYVDANFVNAVNDTVNNRSYAASNMSKVPFSYLPTGSYQSGQAFTFGPGTFIQGGSSALTEIFGSNTDGSSMIAAQGNGDGTSYFTGGLKIGIPNRAQYGQSPEMMARMGSRFLGAGNGYDTNTWVFVPIWKSGDSSTRWIGDPNQRWPEVYATDVNTTTATIGTLNVSSCNGCGGSSSTHLLNYQTNTATLVGNAADKTIYTYTLPGGAVPAGTGVHCYLKAQRVAGTGAITYKWKFGATTSGYVALTSSSVSIGTDAEVFNNPGSTTAQIMNIGEMRIGNTIMSGGQCNAVAAENVANPVAISVTFNAANTEQIKGVTFKCMAEQ